MLFVVLVAAYLTVAAVLVFGHHSIVGDAWSRVANSYYVLFSRDPHLAAIGFVWNPLPSLVVLPLLPFKALWPPLVSEGFAANIVSALFMAGTALQLYRMLLDHRATRAMAIAITLAFAVNPMIVLYAANGMSEAPFLFFLAMATRQLARWIASADVGALAYSGVALALAYLTRYEAVAAVALAAATVAAVSYGRTARGERVWTAVGDAVIISLPAAFAFLSWAIVSWVIVGSPFETFSSMYGNSAQVARAAESIAEATGGTIAERVAYAGSQLSVLLYVTALVVVGSILIAAVKRDARLLAPIAVFGGVLAFALGAFLMGSSFGWLRFYISVIPLAAFVGGLAAVALLSAPADTAGRWWGRVRRAAPYAVTIAAVIAFAVTVPATVQGMLDPRIGRGEPREQLSALMGDVSDGQFSADAYELAGEVAVFLDELELPDGAVLADAANAFPIILRSTDPRQFVITPDRDFEQVMSDPYRFGVRYLLIPRGGFANDAVARGNPGVTREDLAELTMSFEQGAFEWRLYRLLD